MISCVGSQRVVVLLLLLLLLLLVELILLLVVIVVAVIAKVGEVAMLRQAIWRYAILHTELPEGRIAVFLLLRNGADDRVEVVVTRSHIRGILA